jgi:putative methionine-R-sulfoxide reductase with GAF domain
MIDLFKDRYKMSLLMATLFFAGIVASLYQIYRLPYNLMLPSDTHPAFVSVYLVLGITFAVGGLTLWWALTYRKEIIIFRDKQLDNTTSTKEQTEAGKTTISLDSVREQLKNQNDIIKAGIQAICKQLDAGQGAIYLITDGREVQLKGGYALNTGDNTVISYDLGEGLIGQAAAAGKTVYLDDVPDGYIKIISGLGSASPRYLLITPMRKENNVVGVVEVASFNPLSEDQRKFVDEASQLIVEKLASK